MNVVVTYAGSDSTGPGNYDEGVAFGAFDFLSAADYKRHPGDNDERTRLVATGTFGLPWTMKASGTLTLGTGLPYTVYDASAGWDNFVVRWNEGRPQGSKAKPASGCQGSPMESHAGSAIVSQQRRWPDPRQLVGPVVELRLVLLR